MLRLAPVTSTIRCDVFQLLKLLMFLLELVVEGSALLTVRNVTLALLLAVRCALRLHGRGGLGLQVDRVCAVTFAADWPPRGNVWIRNFKLRALAVFIAMEVAAATSCWRVHERVGHVSRVLDRAQDRRKLQVHQVLMLLLLSALSLERPLHGRGQRRNHLFVVDVVGRAARVARIVHIVANLPLDRLACLGN